MAPKQEVKTANEAEFEFDGKKYVQREPSIEETNLADLIRSKAFFEAVRQGVRTEAEIIGALIEQGRFDEERHADSLNKYGSEVRENLVNMASAETVEELEFYYRKAKRARTKLLSVIRQKQSYTVHSAEQKADNAFNIALVAIVTEDKKGKPVLLKRNPDTDSIDIEATFKNAEDPKNSEFVTAALRCFIPFSLGYSSGDLPADPEDTLFASRLAEINGEGGVEDLEEEEVDPDGDEIELPESLEPVIKEPDFPEIIPVTKTVDPKEPVKTEQAVGVKVKPKEVAPIKRTSNEDVTISDGGGVKVGGPKDTQIPDESGPVDWTPPPITPDMAIEDSKVR